MKKNKFRLNSNKQAFNYNINLVKPNISHEDWLRRSVSMTKDTKDKLDTLRAKYKLSRSALIRILIDSVE